MKSKTKINIDLTARFYTPWFPFEDWYMRHFPLYQVKYHKQHRQQKWSTVEVIAVYHQVGNCSALYHDENKTTFDETMMMTALCWTNLHVVFDFHA